MENLEKTDNIGHTRQKRRQTKHKYTTQEANKISNTDPTQNGGEPRSFGMVCSSLSNSGFRRVIHIKHLVISHERETVNQIMTSSPQ